MMTLSTDVSGVVAGWNLEKFKFELSQWDLWQTRFCSSQQEAGQHDFRLHSASARLGDGSSSSKLNTAFGECSSFQIRIRWRKMHSRSRGQSWFNNEKSWSATSRGLYQLLLPAVWWKWWHGHSCTAGPLRLMFYWILSPIKVSAEERQWRGYAGWAQLSRR